MSNGKTHRAVGTAAGAVFAGARARDQPIDAFVAEILGGALAGNVGARLPDIIDPPTSPRHRSIAHGIVPVGGTGIYAASSMNAWQGKLRAAGERQRQLSKDATDALSSFWHWLLAMLCHMGAGAIAGVVAGYGSHIALDSLTPAGLPVFA